MRPAALATIVATTTPVIPDAISVPTTALINGPFQIQLF